MDKSETERRGTFVKALALNDLSDLDMIKSEISSGNILILKITPLAKKSIGATKQAISKLCEYVQKEGGDIARLGEERIVLTPSTIKIWRGKENLPHSRSKAFSPENKGLTGA